MHSLFPPSFIRCRTLLFVCMLIACGADAQVKYATSYPVAHVDTFNYTWTGSVKNKMRDGEWQGVQTVFKDTIRAHYSNGKLNGAWTVHYKTGKLRESGSYVNNHRDGRWMKFDNQGDTIFYCTYKAGILNGPYRTFTSHNRPTRSGNFLNGNRDGTWIESAYNSQGGLMTETFYRFQNDTLNGPCQRYDADGISTTHYVNGEVMREEYKQQGSALYTPEVDRLPESDEVIPSFPGGEAALQQYLADSLRYPKGCAQVHCEGNVYVQFTVEQDGSITDAHVVKGIPAIPEMDAEALRLISAMPRWSPGRMNGRAIPVKMTCPVKFRSN